MVAKSDITAHDNVITTSLVWDYGWNKKCDNY